MGFPAFLPPSDMGGLHALSLVNGRVVVHPNLAGPPPGCAPEDGRVVVVKDENLSKASSDD